MYTQEDDVANVNDACGFLIEELAKAIYLSDPDSEEYNQLPRLLQHALESPPAYYDQKQLETVIVLFYTFSRQFLVLLESAQTHPEGQSLKEALRQAIHDIHSGRS